MLETCWFLFERVCAVLESSDDDNDDDEEDDDDGDDNDAASEGYWELLSSPIVDKCQPHLRDTGSSCRRQ